MQKKEIRIGSLTAAPGQKVQGFLIIETIDYRMPITILNGIDVGPTVGITSGIHGAEYPGIEAAIRLSRELDPAYVRGAVVIVHPVNVAGFHARSIYVNPLDGKNINRVFPGNPAGTAAERIADSIFQNVILPSDYYLDLHGGDMIEALVPFTIYSRTGRAELDNAAREMAKAYGLPYAVAGATAGGSYGAAAAAGKPALLAEAGGLGRLDEEAVLLHVRGVKNVLRHLGVLADGGTIRTDNVAFLSGMSWLRSENAGLLYPMVKVGDRVTQGSEVAEVRDYFGNTIAKPVAPASGVVLFLVTSLAINVGDPILAVGKE